MYEENIRYLNKMIFRNSTRKNMSLREVEDQLIDFMNQDIRSSYIVAIGSDSHVKNHSCFVTAIHIHRIGEDGIGKGAWGCIKEYVLPRKVKSLREKIALEATLTHELITQIDFDRIVSGWMAAKGRDEKFHLEAHLDIGTQGATRQLIQEMVGWFSGIGIKTCIKPDSYAASCYADRYTKKG